MCIRDRIPLAFFALSFENELQYHCLNVCANSGDDVAIYCKNLVNFWPGNSRDNGAHLRTSGTTRPKNRRISLNIPGNSGWIFATFSPYESALCADDGSVLIFQFIKGRCHGNQIMLP